MLDEAMKEQEAGNHEDSTHEMAQAMTSITACDENGSLRERSPWSASLGVRVIFLGAVKIPFLWAGTRTITGQRPGVGDTMVADL